MVDIANYNYIGARGLHPDEQYKIGDMTRNSKDWDFENDCSSEKDLGGISSITIDINRIFDEPNDIEKKIANAADTARLYGDGRIAIIAGNLAEYGDDPNEIVIKNAIVIALM